MIIFHENVFSLNINIVDTFFRMNSYLKVCSSVIKKNCQNNPIVIVRCLSSSRPKHGNKELSKVIKNEER